jgi:TAG lipase/steryl ester hydrolase/phospholipase A2/LPA acyltransferase
LSHLPLLVLIFDFAASLVVYSAASAALRAWHDSKNEQVQQRRAIIRKMAASKSYFEWSINATKLDAIDGTDDEARWRSETKLYDRRLLEEKVAHLLSVKSRSNATVTERIFAVRADLIRNLGNVASAALHEHFPLVPGPIREYIDEVREHLEDITNSTELPLAEKSAFLKETRHAFGRTALVLSGGGALGTFHLGVIKALLEHRLLPRVLAGSSVGAVVCAVTATRTDSELSALLENISSFDLTFFSHAALPVPAASSTAGKLLLGTSSMQANEDPEQLVRRLRHLLGDVTFVEAYTHTSRVLNLSVSAAGGNEPPRLLNYLTAPHVVVWSAVACSSAFPGLPQPRELLARSVTGELVRFADSNAAGLHELMMNDMPSSKKLDGGGGGGVLGCATPTNTGWRDGSLEDDLPMRGLSEMFGVNHFIVSQTTPHIIPFLNLKKQLGVAGQLAEAEIKHRCRQALEILPRWKWPARWLRAFSQPWEGDVTIALPHAVAQLAKGIIGPSRSALLQAVRQGELSTWAKISAIQCNCGIEATLDACIQHVAAWERAEQKDRRMTAAALPSKSGRLPSWADLDSLQQQHQQKFPHNMPGSSSVESLYSMSLSHAVGAIGAGATGVPSPGAVAAPGCMPKYRVSSHGSLPAAAGPGVFPSPEKEGGPRTHNTRVSFSKFSSSEADLKHLAVIGIPSSEYMVSSPSPPHSLHSPQALYKKGGMAAPPLPQRPASAFSPLPPRLPPPSRIEKAVSPPITRIKLSSPLGSLMECIDSSANPFPEGSPSPLSRRSFDGKNAAQGIGEDAQAAIERRSSLEIGLVNNRNGLDWIAP